MKHISFFRGIPRGIDEKVLRDLKCIVESERNDEVGVGQFVERHENDDLVGLISDLTVGIAHAREIITELEQRFRQLKSQSDDEKNKIRNRSSVPTDFRKLATIGVFTGSLGLAIYCGVYMIVDRGKKASEIGLIDAKLYNEQLLNENNIALFKKQIEFQEKSLGFLNQVKRFKDTLASRKKEIADQQKNLAFLRTNYQLCLVAKPAFLLILLICVCCYFLSYNQKTNFFVSNLNGR